MRIAQLAFPPDGQQVHGALTFNLSTDETKSTVSSVDKLWSTDCTELKRFLQVASLLRRPEGAIKQHTVKSYF